MTRDINLGDITIEMVLKITGLEQITKGVSVAREQSEK